MGQVIRFLKITKKSDPYNKENRPTMLVINKNSIGRINTSLGMREYNMHLLPTNTIDFDKINVPKSEKTKKIFITRK